MWVIRDFRDAPRPKMFANVCIAQKECRDVTLPAVQSLYGIQDRLISRAASVNNRSSQAVAPRDYGAFPINKGFGRDSCGLFDLPCAGLIRLLFSRFCC